MYQKWIADGSVICTRPNDCLSEPVQILSQFTSVYNSLSAAIHLYMIRAFEQKKCVCVILHSSVVFKIHKGWKSKGDYKIHCTFSSSSRSSHILYALIMGHLMCFLKWLTSFQIFDADHHCHHQKNFRLVILYQLPTEYTFRYTDTFKVKIKSSVKSVTATLF